MDKGNSNERYLIEDFSLSQHPIYGFSSKK